MKYVFIVNPMAGDRTAQTRLEAALANRGNCEIYCTKGPKDATQYILRRCSEHPAEQCCYVACGGDGTINEVACGVAGQPNASMTVYPCGSGNDFVKALGGADRFLDLDALLNAREHCIDVMKVNDRMCVNAFHFGLDTCVARTMNRVRKYPILGGKNSYVTGVIHAVLTAMRTRCTVTINGECINDGDILLCTLANGRYVGGSYLCAPRAAVDDGLFEVCLVRPVSRLKLLRLIKVYIAGTHLDDPRFEKIVCYRRGDQAVVEGPEGFSAAVDGEVIPGRKFTVQVCPKALRFAIPEPATKPVLV